MEKKMETTGIIVPGWSGAFQNGWVKGKGCRVSGVT